MRCSAGLRRAGRWTCSPSAPCARPPPATAAASPCGARCLSPPFPSDHRAILSPPSFAGAGQPLAYRQAAPWRDQCAALALPCVFSLLFTSYLLPSTAFICGVPLPSHCLSPVSVHGVLTAGTVRGAVASWFAEGFVGRLLSTSDGLAKAVLQAATVRSPPSDGQRDAMCLGQGRPERDTCSTPGAYCSVECNQKDAMWVC